MYEVHGALWHAGVNCRCPTASTLPPRRRRRRRRRRRPIVYAKRCKLLMLTLLLPQRAHAMHS